jgi:rhodanese-related sulfurtransferase
MKLLTGLTVAALVSLTFAGCGDDGDGGDGGDGGGAPPVAIELVGPDGFAERMADREAVVVNVHVPYEGEIAGTDLFVPFDEVGSSTRLPDDHDRPLLVYCRTGNMSATATAALVDAGYTDVTDLEGGMVAWEAVGHPIAHDPDPDDTGS